MVIFESAKQSRCRLLIFLLPIDLRWHHSGCIGVVWTNPDFWHTNCKRAKIWKTSQKVWQIADATHYECFCHFSFDESKMNLSQRRSNYLLFSTNPWMPGTFDKAQFRFAHTMHKVINDGWCRQSNRNGERDDINLLFMSDGCCWERTAWVSSFVPIHKIEVDCFSLGQCNWKYCLFTWSLLFLPLSSCTHTHTIPFAKTFISLGSKMTVWSWRRNIFQFCFALARQPIACYNTCEYWVGV